MAFNFGSVANIQKVSTTQQLTANKIHVVKFMGAEAQDVKGTKDPNQVFKVLDLKFEGVDGVYNHRIFEWTDRDSVQTETSYGKNPSRIEQLMTMVLQLADVVSPKFADAARNGQVSFNDWNDFRTKMVKYLAPGVGTEMQIKLVRNNNGMATLPAFPMAFNKNGDPYNKSVMFAAKDATPLKFTRGEQEKIDNELLAAPTTPTFSVGGGNTEVFGGPTQSNDLNFEL